MSPHDEATNPPDDALTQRGYDAATGVQLGFVYAKLARVESLLLHLQTQLTVGHHSECQLSTERWEAAAGALLRGYARDVTTAVAGELARLRDEHPVAPTVPPPPVTVPEGVAAPAFDAGESTFPEGEDDEPVLGDHPLDGPTRDDDGDLL